MAKHILVIDDDLAVRNAFKLSLSREGYSVETADNGEAGVLYAEARLPDLIFLDLRMPGIDGVETLRRLQVCCAGIPVYIVTAFRRDFAEALEQAVREGLQFQLMEKPLPPAKIRAIARAVLGSGPELV